MHGEFTQARVQQGKTVRAGDRTYTLRSANEAPAWEL